MRRTFRPFAAILAALMILTIAGPSATAHQLSCAPEPPFAGTWPMIGHDVQSTRNQTAEHFLDASNAPLLQPAWTFDANYWTGQQNNEVTSYPVETDGCVFVGTSTGNDANANHLPGWVFAINADNGQVVWQTKMDDGTVRDAGGLGGGAVYSTLAVADGIVYAFVSRVGAPTLVALDEQTGRVLWATVVDHQVGSDAVSSPVPYDGMIWVGVSGTAAEGSATDRNAFQGSTVLVAAKEMVAPDFGIGASDPVASGTKLYEPGQIIRKLYSIPKDLRDQGYAGASQWGNVSIDPDTGFAYEGTGNPFNYDFEAPQTNAVLKMDFNLNSPNFGQLVGSYKGDIETYVQQGAGLIPCSLFDQISGFFGAGLECAHLDLDFGSTPNIIHDATGRKLIVVGQKSGVVHYIDPDTMTAVTKVRLGVPSAVGGMVGSAATDCTTDKGLTDYGTPCRIYGSHTIGGYLYSLDTAGTPQWVSPTADGVHWGEPTTFANRVLYTVDLAGFFDAYDAGTGAPLLHRPMSLPGVEVSTAPSVTRTGSLETIANPTFSWGAATVAHHMVYASVGVGLTSAQGSLPSMPDGFVIAYKPFNSPVPIP